MYKTSALFIALVVSCFVSTPKAQAQGQSQPQGVLSQSQDQLLQGFDVDPSYLNKFQPTPATTTKSAMLLKLLGAAMPSINIDTTSGDKTIRVKAPFVNVDLGSGRKNVRVRAPFVKVDTGLPSPVSVNVPGVTFNQPGPVSVQPPNNNASAQQPNIKQEGATPSQSVSH